MELKIREIKRLSFQLKCYENIGQQLNWDINYSWFSYKISEFLYAILDIYRLDTLKLESNLWHCEMLESYRRPAEIQNLNVLVDFTPPTEPVSVSLVWESSPTTAPEPGADRRTAALRSLCRVEDMQSVSKAGPRARRRWWCKWSGRVSRWKRSCPPAGVSSLRVPAPVSPLDKTSRHRARAGRRACVRWPGQLWRVFRDSSPPSTFEMSKFHEFSCGFTFWFLVIRPIR